MEDYSDCIIFLYNIANKLNHWTKYEIMMGQMFFLWISWVRRNDQMQEEQ